MDEQRVPLREGAAASTSEHINRAGKAFPQSRGLSIVIALFLIFAIGVADYFSGYQTYWSIFYLLAISFAAWNVGVLFALFLSGLSIVSWLIGDWAAGVVYPNRFVPIWNALITLGSYLIVVWLLSSLKSFHQILEDRIRQRTAALRHEISARKQLEKEVAEVTERERRRIGHDLHDTLCQHLTATSLSLQVLRGKLADGSLPPVKDADASVELVEKAIDLTRKLAKGLFPMELQGAGLSGALQELCRSTADRYHGNCKFSDDPQTPMLDSITATYHYRIAQEAVTNAVKHGHINQVNIGLSCLNGELVLSISDDGIGLPASTPTNQGLGLRIMASRAGMIGATFSAKNKSQGGVIVVCGLQVTSGGSH